MYLVRFRTVGLQTPYALAKEARVRKFGEMLPTDPKDKNKQIRHLQYKGVAMDMIFEALS
ncbi:hypothetical protein FKD06_25170 [Serratia sp. SRS-8-S-2018]|nr:RecX family transcriptional regulator [Serratia sp. SRS-8-S-2018]TPW39323.1 hypothetical protein FKD06_25170 [Serratia sp. SRS-8-S-2018]